ncbi:MAG: uroporphyrinogen decarboxylase family protein [Oliverpabstia sp.]
MDRKNTLKALLFDKPDYIPVNFVINDSCWYAYPQEALLELISEHRLLFPDFVKPELPYTPKYANVAQKNHPYTDDWGCLWETTDDGITGTVTKHPLSDWANYPSYKIPDPSVCMGIGKIDWQEERKRIKKLKENGEFAMGGLRHGHTFLQICDIRGYEEAIFDMEDEEPLLVDLLEKITDFNLYIIQQYLDMDADVITYAEDLGMQYGPMLSPACFERYILPCYRRIMKPAREKGKIIHMHSDGDIRTLAPYLMEKGVHVLNLQDLINGISWIKENVKGKVAIDLDIDRQKITPYGTPKEIEELIREEVSELGNEKGGLMLTYGLYPGIPLENIKALMDALERYALYFA